ncbi:MAG: hypothetical protein IJ593_02155 [Lachnospiraceae bacterium]|nr:hypothetical protein [Lachnospiraceae bacterium]
MEKVEKQEIDANERLKELAEERKAIIQDIINLKDEVIKESNRVLAKKVFE